jgi:hypothetical protein
MEWPMPVNDREAGYLAYALVGTVIDLLLERQVIGESELVGLLEAASKRLSQVSNGDTHRAADFVRTRMIPQKDIER